MFASVNSHDFAVSILIVLGKKGSYYNCYAKTKNKAIC